MGPDTIGGNIITGLEKDRKGNLWIAGSKGLLVVSSTGNITRYDDKVANFIQTTDRFICHRYNVGIEITPP